MALTAAVGERLFIPVAFAHRFRTPKDETIVALIGLTSAPRLGLPWLKRAGIPSLSIVILGSPRLINQSRKIMSVGFKDWRYRS